MIASIVSREGHEVVLAVAAVVSSPAVLAPASLVGASTSWRQRLAWLRLEPTWEGTPPHDGQRQSDAVAPLLIHSSEQNVVVVVAAVAVVEKWSMAAAVVGPTEAAAAPQAVEPCVPPWRRSPYLWAFLLHFDSPWH